MSPPNPQSPAKSQPPVWEGLNAAGLSYLVSQNPAGGGLVLLTPREERVDLLWQNLVAFGIEALPFPGDLHVPFADFAADFAVEAQRLRVRQAIIQGDRPAVIVASVAALQGRWMPQDVFCNNSVTLHSGASIDREALATRLLVAGFQRVALVEDEGTFAVRGGIVDVFPAAYPRPVRIDLFGDEVASLKTFDPGSQRTFASLSTVVFHPIRPVVYGDDTVACAQGWLRRFAEHDDAAIPSRRLGALRHEVTNRTYFYGVERLWPAFYEGSDPIIDTLLPAGSDVALVVDELDAVESVLETRWQQAIAERQETLAHHWPAVEVAQHLVAPEDLLPRLHACLTTAAKTLADDTGDAVVPHDLSSVHEVAREIAARRADATLGDVLDPLEKALRQAFDRGDEVFLTCRSHGAAERLRELLRARGIDLPLQEGLPPAPSLGARVPPRRAVAVAALSGGFRDAARGVLLITDVEIFATPSSPRTKRRRPAGGVAVGELANLDKGDLIIHVDCGIGRYEGLERLVIGGVDGDYVHLVYAGGDKLYVPAYRLNLLQRFRGNPASVRLDKLGGTRWEKAKQRVRDAVLVIAHELLALQARRQALGGFALPPPGDHFRAFAAAFPYEETPDQQKAIDDVLTDLSADVPMDRVVCGDVGFGKTEVALRAAFLTVLGGKQVAVLVPTTVLAEQHGETFRARFAGEALRVEVLNRFRSPGEIRAIVEGLRTGSVDVVVGTHRLLSGDVWFKDLGLLVVDEEQRFGVKHKERIKQLRSHVHVLTLTATPIPRTLHMASTKLRDLSLIQTPPEERSSVRTEVTRFREEVIQEALRAELHRGGQAFVVHNRVQSIQAMADLVRRLVPEARVAIAHGQMGGGQLERIMVAFVRREINVLVCTAIVESGIDIPSANTMVINRADTFGLAQLHQLRGRIGRGRERAYAYLLLPRTDRISKDAASRLAVLKRFSQLGAGFQIASHDLELRGAGDLLGRDQSGNIHAVGYELYTELLAEAVERAKAGDGAALRQDREPSMNIPVAAVLPETYIPQPVQRLLYYQRLAQAESDAQIFDVYGELKDFYGNPPDEVAHLVEIMVIRRRLKILGAIELSAVCKDGLVHIGMMFGPDAGVDRGDLVRRCRASESRYRVLPSGRLAIVAQDIAKTDLALLRLVRQEIGDLHTQDNAVPVGQL